MTDYDKRVNDEADEHAQMMSKRREFWDAIFKIHDEQVRESKLNKEQDNEINNQ